MNRPNLALGLSFWSMGLYSIISSAVNKLLVLQKLIPKEAVPDWAYLAIPGLIFMILGSFFIAYAFPKKAS